MRRILINLTTVAIVIAARWRRDDNDLNLDPSGNPRSCTTTNGTNGICVHEAQCNESHYVAVHGVIDDSTLRAKGCPGVYEWCCVLEGINNETKLPVKANQGCTLPTENECPYCVALYRNSGNPYTRAPSGLYCAGTLLGRNIVLTTAGCASHTTIDHIWVQSLGAETSRNYTIKSLIKHPGYNSGTKENDLALMVLTDEMQIEHQELHGACIDFKTSLSGQCVSFGFDKDEKMIMTKLSVNSGRCTSRGALSDAACGHSDDCNVSYGFPVLCPYNGIKELILAGISRDKCKNGTVNLGTLTLSSTWLEEELIRIGLAKHNYTITV